MATSSAAVRRSGGFASISVALYLLITFFIIFNYFRALIQLLPYRDRIMGGYEIAMAPRLSTQGLLVVCAVVLLIVVYYRQILGVLRLVPAGIRGLVLPIPFYFLGTGDRNLAVVLVVLGAVLWVLYHPLGAILLAAMGKVPRPILEPLARFWAAILYTALVSRAILPVVLAVAVLVGYHFLDQVMERVFAPVWDWHRSLPAFTWLGLFTARLVVGATTPFLLSMYFAWFNWGYDTATPIYAVLVGFLGYFVLRMPREDPPCSSQSKERAMPASIPLFWRLWWKAILFAALLFLLEVGIASADDCSGPGDCAGTTWFDNALNNGLIGTLLGGLGLTPIINLLFPGLKIPGMPGVPVTRLPSGPVSAQDAANRMNHLAQFAQRNNNRELADLLNKYKGSLVGPDGKLRQDQWDRFRDEARGTIDRWSQSGERPNSWVWDAGASVLGAGKEFVVQVGGVIKDAAIWVGTKELELGDAILHPIDTLNSLKETGKAVLVNTMTWMDEHIGRELAHEFQDAWKEGRYWDALKAFGKAEGTLFTELGTTIGKEILPIDEIKSFFDPTSDLETKLWAFPAAVTKLASLITMSERLMTMPVPGLDKTLTLIPSVGKAAQVAVQAEKLAALTKVEGPLGQAARATQKVEGIMGKALAESGPITNYRQLQNLVRNNPELKEAIDQAIKAGGDGSSLYTMAASNTMSKEAHMLITARKMELQEQAIMSATRRIIQEEAAAIQQAGGKVPGSYQTFNATQGSRVNLNGANVKADLDQTLLGIKNVPPDRARQILAEEVKKLGMDMKNLDTNVYVPKRGLADVTGDKPFSEDALKRILNQGTSESGRYQVYVGRDGQVHVTGPFKGQGADVLGPGSVTHDPTLTVRPSTPMQALTPQQAVDRVQQIKSIDKYAQAGEWDKVVKSANRASDLGAFDQPTRDLIRKLAYEKRPAELTQLLNQSGYASWSDLVNHLNGFGA